MESLITSRLKEQGIVVVAPLYSSAEIVKLNAQLDPLLEPRSHLARSYVWADEIDRHEMLHAIFNERMLGLISDLMPEAQLYHCLVSEIAAKQDKPHLKAETLSGWHRDSDTIVGFRPEMLLHVSIFVYLTDVFPGYGAFEIAPQLPDPKRLSRAGSIKVEGPAGTTFAWNRSFYHRASPNSGPVRRRLLKLSVQPFMLPNSAIDKPQFREVRTRLEPGSFLGQLFGLQTSTARPSSSATESVELLVNSTVEVSRLDLARYRVQHLRIAAANTVRHLAAR